MTIVRWAPYREFSHLQQRINRVFGEAYRAPEPALVATGSWVPPVDVFQSGEHEIVLKAELPDLSREAIDVTVDNGTLTIKGEKKSDSEVKDTKFHLTERRYGSFSRSFSLPATVDATKVAADYKNGILTVRLPLREEAKPRQVKVDVAA